MNEYIQTIDTAIKSLNDAIWGWPLIIAFIVVGAIATWALNFVQIRYFFKAWKLVLAPEEKTANKGDMTPFQAFLNALSSSVGNGALAGMATAVHQGGPGAAFWIFILGFFALPIRYCEVYLSNAFSSTGTGVLGGPMLYLKQVPGRFFLPSFYAFFCLMLAFTGGNAMQANSIGMGVQSLIAVPIWTIALAIGAFVLYVMLGGAERIVRISQAIVPVKVGLFFLSAIIVLGYHFQSIAHAAQIIITSAFTPQAITGALLGTTMQSAIRFGMSRSLNATEIGLGVAAVFFGSTGSKNPVENGIMSMVSAFISNYLVCFVMCFMIVLTGVWTQDLTAINLTTAAYTTVFGSFAAAIVTLLSVIFGVGVLVAYAYAGRECWAYLTGGRFMHVYSLLYCFLAFAGTIAKVDIVWSSIDIVNAGLVTINLYGILVLMPVIARGMREYRAQHTK